jgi:hypothetical protein
MAKIIRILQSRIPRYLTCTLYSIIVRIAPAPLIPIGSTIYMCKILKIELFIFSHHVNDTILLLFKAYPSKPRSCTSEGIRLSLEGIV